MKRKIDKLKWYKVLPECNLNFIRLDGFRREEVLNILGLDKHQRILYRDLIYNFDILKEYSNYRKILNERELKRYMLKISLIINSMMRNYLRIKLNHGVTFSTKYIQDLIYKGLKRIKTHLINNKLIDVNDIIYRHFTDHFTTEFTEVGFYNNKYVENKNLRLEYLIKHKNSKNKYYFSTMRFGYDMSDKKNIIKVCLGDKNGEPLPIR